MDTTVLNLLLLACMAGMVTSDSANDTLVAQSVSSNFSMQLQQEFDACRLNDSQEAALGRPDVVGKVRICISPWTPLVFCTPDKDQSTYTGYTVEVFKALAQRVPWLSDFSSWYFDCMDWTPMIDDLGSEAGSCLMAPSGLSPGDLAGKDVEMSWITDKQGLRILTIPHHSDANLWAPLTVFSVPVWALIFGTGVFVGVILWLFDTRARSLLRIPVNSKNHALQKALRKQSEVIIARLLSAQMPKPHQHNHQQQPGQQDSSSFTDNRQSRLAGPRQRYTAGGASEDLDCQVHLSLDSESSDIFSSESESSAVIADDASCRAVRTAAGINTTDVDEPENNHHHQQQQKQQQQQLKQLDKDPAGAAAAAEDCSRHGQRQRKRWKHTGTTHLLRWLGVKPGKEKKALKLLSSNVVRSLLRLPDMREPPSESQELQQCGRLWGKISTSGNRWDREWGLQALAAAQRVEISLAQYADDMVKHIQPHAVAFGEACNIDPAFILNFSEEVVRGQSVFVLSQLLADLEKHLRQAAGAGAWQIVSQVPAVGEVVVGSLGDMQGKSFDRPVIILAQQLGGMEDIPPGVTAVLTVSSTDVLSHVAIRARSQGVLLASCFDDAEWGKLVVLQGKHIDLEVNGAGNVTAVQVDPPSSNGNGSGFPGASASRRLTLAAPGPWTTWAVLEEQFGPGVVGNKAGNLAKLRKALPSWINVPASVAVPFWSFERVMSWGINTHVAGRVRNLQEELGRAQVGSGIPPALKEIRRLVSQELQAPEEFVHELSRVAASAGLAGAESWSPGSTAWQPVWKAIAKVWSSQWAERAWLSRQACGVPEGQLCMSVLLQQVVDGQYAFVLHTANPLTGRHGDMFGELVAGLGEVLVGNYPGRALSFSDSPGAPEPKLHSLPSKRVALYAPQGGTLIARSDTNGEDLEAFAGAGLYDSVPVVPLSEVTIEAADEPLFWDPSLRSRLIDSIVDVGQAVEDAFGGVAQDIEGVWREGQLVVVQARPQVLPEASKNGNGRN